MNPEHVNTVRAYWEKNIENWGAFYAETSHFEEEIEAPWWLKPLYVRTIVPLERKLMKRRYQLTMEFIDAYVQPGMTVLDVGCGTGRFTVEMLRRDARVVAIDFAEAALQLTKEHVSKIVPECRNRLECIQMDISTAILPRSDAVLAMGLTPYLSDLSAFYRNVLSTTELFYCLVLNPKNWANRLRRWLPLLNVRNVHCFAPATVDELLEKHHFRLQSRTPFATGYLDLAVRKEGRLAKAS